MSAGVPKTERVLNLLALLLETSRPLSRAELTSEISGYPSSETACRRSFERDKELLRTLGVPLRTETLADGVEAGYRVLPREYFLPDLDLDPDETAALTVAVGGVALGTAAGSGALLKIGALASGASVPIAALPMVPALERLFAAVRRRCVVSFQYPSGAKTVEPWAITSERGRWYLVGRDVERNERRTFRADRIVGDVSLGPDAAFDVPPDADRSARVATAPFDNGGASQTVRLRVAPPAATTATTRLGDDADVTPQADGSVICEFEASNIDAVRSFVLEFGDHAEALEPQELRDSIVTWLRQILDSECA